MTKRLKPDNINYCKTKNFYPEFLSKSFTETIVTLDTFPLDIIICITTLLGFVEKHVLRFVCKKIRLIVHCVSVSNKQDFNLPKLCPDISLNGYFEVLKWVIEGIGCLLDQRTYYNIALGGHLEISRWAIGK
jgi:hypothetical protein